MELIAPCPLFEQYCQLQQALAALEAVVSFDALASAAEAAVVDRQLGSQASPWGKLEGKDSTDTGMAVEVGNHAETAVDGVASFPVVRLGVEVVDVPDWNLRSSSHSLHVQSPLRLLVRGAPWAVQAEVPSLASRPAETVRCPVVLVEADSVVHPAQPSLPLEDSHTGMDNLEKVGEPFLPLPVVGLLLLAAVELVAAVSAFDSPILVLHLHLRLCPPAAAAAYDLPTLHLMATCWH